MHVILLAGSALSLHSSGEKGYLLAGVFGFAGVFVDSLLGDLLENLEKLSNWRVNLISGGVAGLLAHIIPMM